MTIKELKYYIENHNEKYPYLDFHTHKKAKNAIKNIIVQEQTPLQIPKGMYSAGIHPWYVEKEAEEQLKTLENLLQKEDNNLLFIGECGLDKVKGENFLLQKKVFEAQIKLSEQYQKPLVIHCVRAYNEIMELHRLYTPAQIWVIHGFNKGKQLATQLTRRGIKLSFGAGLLKSPQQQEALSIIDKKDFFLETDDQTTVKIQEIYTLASWILNVSINKLQQQTLQNLWQIIG